MINERKSKTIRLTYETMILLNKVKSVILNKHPQIRLVTDEVAVRTVTEKYLGKIKNNEPEGVENDGGINDAPQNSGGAASDGEKEDDVSSDSQHDICNDTGSTK